MIDKDGTLQIRSTRFTWLLTLLLCLLVSGKGLAQNKKVSSYNALKHRLLSMNWQNSSERKLKKPIQLKSGQYTLKEIVNDIARKAGFKFSYSKQLIPLNKKISVKGATLTTEQALWKVLEGTSLRFGISASGQLFLFKRKEPEKKVKDLNEKITGTVTDAQSGDTLPGVNIMVKGTTTGTSTDSDGHYQLNVSSLQDTLVFSFIGYQRQVIPINGRTTINIALKMQTISGEEMVVIGYGSQKKKVVTGATAHVDNSTLTQDHSVSTLQNLQGKAPGVRVTSVSGQPGDPVKIRIRGVSTNGDSSPLYVVDGVPTNDISYLNPDDIESVDILKDAASTAIYGTRAANGVVLITTRQGQSGQTNISFQSYYGWQNPTKRLDMLNAKEYGVIMNEAALNSGRSPNYFYSQSQIDSMGAGTDWQRQATNTNAPTQNYNINFSGGNDKSVYDASLFYQKQEGIIGISGNSYYERIGVRINSDHHLYKDILKFGENMAYTHSTKSAIGTGNIYGNSIRGLLNTSPTFPVRNPDGTYAKSTMSPEESNPIAAMDYLNNNKNISDRIFGNAYLQLDFLKNLEFKSTFGVDLSFNSTNSFTPVYSLSTNNVSTTSTANQGLYRNFTWNWDNTLTYNQSFGNHEITLLAGTSAQEYGGFNVSGSKQNLIVADFKHAIIDNGAQGTQKAYGSRSEYALDSYFGRLNYNYKDKYLFTAIVRRDGSTNFGANNRWGTFPSFSAGWVVTNENFFNPKWLDYLKLRGGWGKNGNDQIPNYVYKATVSSQYMGYYFGGVNASGISVGTAPNQTPNPDLKWEASVQTDFGLDARFLQNSLTFNFDWYYKTTKDWLVQPEVPALVGTGGPYINGGDIVNRGIEMALSYNKTVGEVNLNIGGNIAFNHNEATKVPVAGGIIHGSNNVLSSSTEEFYRIQTGYPIGYFWGYKTDGIFQNQQEIRNYVGKNGKMVQPDAKPGDVRFMDLNNDGSIDTGDKTMIGNPNPDFTYGFNLSGAYKGFDMSVSLSGVYGKDIVEGTRSVDRFFNNYTTHILNRWHGEGTSNTVPRVTMGGEANGNYARFSDLYIQNGSYLRVKSVNIGYDLKTLMEELPVKQCRIYVSGSNLLTFTPYPGIDPEVGYGYTESSGNTWSSGIDLGYYPQPRTILIGLDLKI